MTTPEFATAESRPPVVCDMTSAPDTGVERLAEYARLFETAYLGRDRDHTGARWLLRADQASRNGRGTWPSGRTPAAPS